MVLFLLLLAPTEALGLVLSAENSVAYSLLLLCAATLGLTGVLLSSFKLYLSGIAFCGVEVRGRLVTGPVFAFLKGYAYFLRGHLYWKFDPVKVKVLEGFPRPLGPDFFDCAEPANTFR